MRRLLAGVSVNSTRSGTLATGSSVITTLANITGLSVGQRIDGTGIPTGATIVSIDSATQITMSAVATATGAQTLTFYTAIVTDGAEPILGIYATSFGGGTVTVEASPNNGVTWITLTQIIANAAATFTANTLTVCYEVPTGYLARARLTGATNPVNVNVDWGN